MPRKPNFRRMAEWKQTRADNTFIENFLLNMSRVTCHIRKITSGKPGRAGEEAKRQFVIGLVSCLETFFRDMFIYCLDSDTSLLEKYHKETSASQTGNLSTAPAYTVSEQLAGGINFQDLNAVDQTFRHFFDGTGSLSHRLSSYTATVSIPSRADKGPVAALKLPADWQDTLDKLLRLRHRLVHDANYRPDIHPKDLAIYESYVLLVAQFFHFVVASTLRNHRIIVDQNGTPVMFLVDDLISEDWVVVEET